MTQNLQIGGLLVEGTCNPTGSIMVVNLLRKTPAGLRLEGLLFSLRFSQGFEPDLFPPVLPKQLIHRMRPGEPIHTFFEHWRTATHWSRPLSTWGTCKHFAGAAVALASLQPGVCDRPRFTRRGFILWRYPPSGSVSSGGLIS